MQHVVLHNDRLNGVQYGTLKTFEKAILDHTLALPFHVPVYSSEKLMTPFGHGTRWSFVRDLMPKQELIVEGDVLWYILMGPENYELDLFKNWERKAKYRIVYLFDTLEPQFPLIKKLFSNDLFNIRITSFHDAVPALESLTGNKWHAIEQAVPDFFFRQVPVEDRVIDFSSYGRRLPGFHEVLKEFCKSNDLYYDYSIQQGGTIRGTAEEAYRQYAWHLTHSKFTISWPVEMTNPKRAGALNPITCRWFEGAAAGAVIVGKKPANEMFDKLLRPDLVVEINPFGAKKEIWNALDRCMDNYETLANAAANHSKENSKRWSWSNRVKQIMSMVPEAWVPSEFQNV